MEFQITQSNSIFYVVVSQLGIILKYGDHLHIGGLTVSVFRKQVVLKIATSKKKNQVSIDRGNVSNMSWIRGTFFPTGDSINMS